MLPVSSSVASSSVSSSARYEPLGQEQADHDVTRNSHRRRTEADGPIDLLSVEQNKTGNGHSIILLNGDCGSSPGLLDADQLQSPDQQEISFLSMEDALARLPWGRWHYQILVASGLCFSADGMQVVLLSFLTPLWQIEWHTSATETAGLTSSLFAGALLGALLWGPAADAWGRRPICLAAAAIIVAGSLATAAATNAVSAAVAIVLVGIGVGGLTVPFDILAEFLPSQGRGTNLLLIEYAWTMGVLYVVLISFVCLSSGEATTMSNANGRDAWRYVALWCAVPCALSFVVGYLVVPESPRWLASQGRTEEALQVLHHAAATNGLDADELFPDSIALQPVEREKQASFSDLLQPQWRNIMLRLWGGWFTSAFGYYGTILVTSRIFFVKQSTDNGDDSSQSDSGRDTFDYNAIFVSSLAEFVGTSMVIWTVDRVGRIPTQVVSYLMAGALLCLLCILANDPSTAATSSSWRWSLIAVGFGARVFEMAATCTTWVTTAEVLPTEIRGTGHSTANAMARLGAFGCPFVVQNSHTPLVKVGIVMLLVHLFTAFCLARLPETAGREMGLATTDHVGDDSLDTDHDSPEHEIRVSLPEPS
jgi:MFS family permease